MYSRLFFPPKKESYFLFGPRGVGKTSWLRQHYPNAFYVDLLDSAIFNDLRAQPSRLFDKIPKRTSGPIIIDEIQKLPSLLDEIHHQMNLDRSKYQYILTGSSARKLRQKGHNLLAGRLRIENFYPFLSQELASDFDLKRAMRFGMLPEVWTSEDPEQYLESYLRLYLDQEVRLEGLARNIEDFSRFLEGASLSQASLLNISNVASDVQVHRKTVESYFEILEDLLIAYRLPVFQKKSKRELIKHNKFYFFDVGLFQTIRPKGLLDSPAEVGGAAFETLILQHLKATNEIYKLKFNISFWRTKNHHEVDFVLYGPKGFLAIEVKSSLSIREKDLTGLFEFQSDFPQANCFVIYGGKSQISMKGIKIIPAEDFFKDVLGSLEIHLNITP